MTTLVRKGEFGLLDSFQKRGRGLSAYAQKRGWKILVPNGDDAFVAKMTTNYPLVCTTDALQEGTHFNLAWMGRYLGKKEIWRTLGYKAMAVSLSDLAAMGDVEPVFALVTAGLNGDISVDSVDNLYDGILQSCEKFKYFVAGGDLFRSDKSILSVTVVGRLIAHKAVQRSGARNLDVLMSSGPLGLSEAGLAILKKTPKISDTWAQILVEKHLKPEPRFKEGRVLADEANMATSLMDTSDDLMTSLEILGKKSGVGFEVNLECIPIHPALAQFSRRFRAPLHSYTLYGGEDYQLLFTIPPSKVEALRRKIPGSIVLGKASAKIRGIRVLEFGRRVSLPDIRFRHF